LFVYSFFAKKMASKLCCLHDYWKKRTGESASSAAANDDDDDVSLNADQRRAVELALEGHSLFLGGPPGTGKSRTIGQMVLQLRRRGRRVSTVATTGAAALAIGAVTIHSWAGIGMGERGEAELAQNVPTAARARWLETDVLVIDEVSMLSGQLLDKLAVVGQILRGGPQLFGGLQLVLVGDFFQLPPIWSAGSRLNQEHLRAQAAPNAPSSVRVTDRALFAFESNTWKELVRHAVELTEVFRQRDPAYLELLGRARTSSELRHVCAELDKLKRPVEGPLTRLMSKNDQVDLVNMQSLGRLPADTERTYTCSDWFKAGLDRATAKAAKQSLNGEEVLTLRTGAQVLLTSNVSRTLVNGSVGVVLGFARGHDCQRVRDYGDCEDGRDCPVVEFKCGTRLIVCYDRKTVTIGPDEVAHRDQLPLRLAWAVTIHRSQGMTLDAVAIDLTQCFAEGQAYVALSRCRTLEGMQVLGYDQGRSFRSSLLVAAWTRQRRQEGLEVRLGSFVALRHSGQVSDEMLTEVVSVWGNLFEGIGPFSRFTERTIRETAMAQKICRGFPVMRDALTFEPAPGLETLCTRIAFVRDDGSVRHEIVL
jgi:ATP-dependent DNA helicase PIF1